MKSSSSENIKKVNNFEGKIKNTFKKSSSSSKLNKSFGNERNELLDDNKNNKNRIINYLSNISFINNEDFLNNKKIQASNKSIYYLANNNRSKSNSVNLSLSEKILLEIFINISEFNESNYEFFITYINLCKLLKDIELIDKELFNKSIITQNDLDIILKEIYTNKNSSKKLNYKNFLRFLAHLTYKFDHIHFVDKPKRALNFIISKYFYNYHLKNKKNVVNLIYSYVLTIKQEKNINEILNQIIPFLNNIYIKFFNNKKENENVQKNKDLDDYKNTFIYITHLMKYISIFPIFVNIKELAIMYYIFLDDNNENKFLEIKELDINKIFTFKKFCQFFLTLCLFIKEKNMLILKQYSFLLKNKKDINNLNELKIEQSNHKEQIIRFILNLKIKNINKQFQINNSKLDDILIKNNEKEISLIDETFSSNKSIIDKIENNFVKDIFQSYSSNFDQNLNYQISFSDIIIFLKDYNLLIKNNNNYSNDIKERISKVQINSNYNINRLKKSLHSLDHMFNKKINKKNKSKNNNLKSNKINLTDLEILFSKVINDGKMNTYKSMDNIFSNKNIFNNNELIHKLNFKSFEYFLDLISKKLNYNSFSEFIDYLSNEKKNIKVFRLMNREINLNDIYKKYKEVNSTELIGLIQEFTPIINIYYISYMKLLKRNEITFNIYLKIFSEFEIFPKIVNINMLKYIFYVLYKLKINNKKDINYNEQDIEYNLIEKEREIGFNGLMNSFGIISLYLSHIISLNKIQSLLGLFHLIIKSEKLKYSLKILNIDYSFIDTLKNKVIEISNRYNNFNNEEEPEYIKFLKEPYL